MRSLLVPAPPHAVRRRPTPIARTALLLTAGGLAAGLAGCGAAASTAAPPTSGASTTAPSPAAAGLTLTDGWVKAVPSGMTAVYGTLSNPSDHDVTVLSAASPVAGMVQLHEVVTVNGAARMQPRTGGFVVPAGGSHQLAPGHDHVMLMDLKQPIKAGDQITVTLSLSGGASVQVTALGKEFAAGNESYAPGGMSMAPGTSMTPGTSMSGMSGSPAK